MPRIHRHTAAALAGLAAFSMTATPASAAEMRAASPAVELPSVAAATEAEQDGWGRYHRRYRRGPSAGDVIAGVAVIGAIAAIASAASKNKRERYEERYPRRYPTREDARYRDRDYDRRYDSGGIERAVDMCVDQVERGRNEVENVDNAARGADGWRVSGRLESGAGFNCWIDNDGRIREIDTDGRYSGTALNDAAPTRNSGYFESAEAAGEGQQQWSDEAYARARAQQRGETYRAAPAARDDRYREVETRSDEQHPAYPGGPVEGDEYPGGEWTGDGRYDTAEAPDFRQNS